MIDKKATSRAEIERPGKRDLGRIARVELGKGEFKQRRRVSDEEGGTLVEMAISSAILVSMLLGIIQLCLALYCYHYVADAAREATRWAIVRGSTSCSNTPNLTNCNATSAQVQTYVRGLGYPYSGGLVATTKWCQASATKPTTWAACSSATANTPGNQVQVQVQYSFPLGVPFVNIGNLSVSSTSEMVIAQ